MRLEPVSMENEIERLRKRVDSPEKKESKEDIVVGRIEEEKVDEILQPSLIILMSAQPVIR